MSKEIGSSPLSNSLSSPLGSEQDSGLRHAHGLFALYEHQIQGMPGIRLNINGAESEDEIWLSVERLHEMRPPEITSAVLRPWVRMTQSPNEEPRLWDAIDGASLIAAGTHYSSATPPEQGKGLIDPEATVILSDYDRAAQVRTLFATYLDTKWHPWAKEEKLRRKTIRLYSQLFTLNQQIEGGIVEAQTRTRLGRRPRHLEIRWRHGKLSTGRACWSSSRSTPRQPRWKSDHAMLTPDLSLTGTPPSITQALLTWRKLRRSSSIRLRQPFRHSTASTFEPLLRTAVTNLDANGIYWPNEVPAEDRTLPKPDDNLKVTDTWVLFARPRTNSLFLQDLEKLKKQAEEANDLPTRCGGCRDRP